MPVETRWYRAVTILPSRYGVDIMRLQSGDRNTPWDGIICTGAADDAICFFVESKDDLVEGHSYKLLYKKDKAHGMDMIKWRVIDFPGIRSAASASDDGPVKIWELVSAH